nr:retrovirus-related Pol polyprotein from transposon TNT 1-94 [Tanacetum cinerariifolium]
MEATRTMLIFSKSSLFLSAEAVTIACYTQNRSLIRKRHNKTPYELLHNNKPDISYLYVFGALCYPTNDSDDLGAVTIACYTQNRSLIRKRHNKTPYELLHNNKPDISYLYVFGALCYPTNDSDDLGKLQPKVDIGIFVGYALAKKAFRIYNKRTRMIIKTIHVDFDELTAIAFEQFNSGPRPQLMTPRTLSSGLMPNPPSSTPYLPPIKNDCDILFQPMFDELLNPPPSVVSSVPVIVAQRLDDPTCSPVSTLIDQDAPSSSNPSTQE